MPPSAAARQVLEQTLALPEAERVLVMTELAASLPSDDDIDPDLLAEIDRPLDLHRRGRSVGRPWDEVRAEVEAGLLSARGPSER